MTTKSFLKAIYQRDPVDLIGEFEEACNRLRQQGVASPSWDDINRETEVMRLTYQFYGAAGLID